VTVCAGAFSLLPLWAERAFHPDKRIFKQNGLPFAEETIPAHAEERPSLCPASLPQKKIFVALAPLFAGYAPAPSATSCGGPWLVDESMSPLSRGGFLRLNEGDGRG